MKIYLSTSLMIFNLLCWTIVYAETWTMQQVKDSHRMTGMIEKQSAPKSELLVFSNMEKAKLWVVDNNNLTLIESIKLSEQNIKKVIFSDNSQYIYLLWADGKVRLYNRRLKAVVAEVKAGLQSSSMAISHDGRYIAIGNLQPHSLVILDAKDLTPLKYLAVKDGFGLESAVTNIYTNPQRETFAVGLSDMPQLWEVSYADRPFPGFSGWEHGYLNESGDLVKAPPFPIRRLIAKETIKDFRFGPDYLTLIGNNDEGIGCIVDVDIRRTLFKIPDLTGLNLSQAAIWNYQNQAILASTQQEQNLLQVIDTESWQAVKSIKLPTAGHAIITHPRTLYAFVELSGHKQLAVIDKASLSYKKNLTLDDSVLELQFDSNAKYLYIRSNQLVKVMDSHSLELVKQISLP